MAEDGKSNDQILSELDALSHTLYQAHTKRRTASLVLPRSAGDSNADGVDAVRAAARPPSRRLSMSPFRSRPNLDKNANDDDDGDDAGAGVALPSKSQSFAAVARAAPTSRRRSSSGATSTAAAAAPRGSRSSSSPGRSSCRPSPWRRRSSTSAGTPWT